MQLVWALPKHDCDQLCLWKVLCALHMPVCAVICCAVMGPSLYFMGIYFSMLFSTLQFLIPFGEINKAGFKAKAYHLMPGFVKTA